MAQSKKLLTVEIAGFLLLCGICSVGISRATRDNPALHCEVCPPAAIGWIEHQTVNKLPLPVDRTTLGIGESMRCLLHMASPNGRCGPAGNDPVQDTLGSVAWSVSGGGSLSNLTGPSTTLTAAYGPGDIVLTAQISDPAAGDKKTITCLHVNDSHR